MLPLHCVLIFVGVFLSVQLPVSYGHLRANQTQRASNNLKNEWIGDGHLQFTFELLNGLFMNSFDTKTSTLESAAFSPFSIQSILMMIHLGAKGATRAEIGRVLHLSSHENNVTFSKSHETFGQALKSLINDPQVNRYLSSANQIFVQEDLHIAQTYSLALQRYHAAAIKYVNFSTAPHQVLTVINDWIAKHTQNMIQNFLSSPPAPTTSLMAVNAIRFKGDWQYKFDATDTEQDAWFRTISGASAKVEMMVAQLPVAFAYNQALTTSIIELPFRSSRLSLFVLLPDDPFGLFQLLGSLNSTVFANLIMSMRKVTNADKTGGVNIRIPKFAIDSTPRITHILKNQLGLKTLFSTEDANLDAMFNGSVHLNHMDEILHKAMIKIDENGSVGAAVSTSSIERVGSFNGQYFEADHPFVYLLMDKHTGLALFAGFYAGPNAEQTQQQTHQQQRSSSKDHHLFGTDKNET